jgi:hypothetical protein
MTGTVFLIYLLSLPIVQSGDIGLHDNILQGMPWESQCLLQSFKGVASVSLLQPAPNITGTAHPTVWDRSYTLWVEIAHFLSDHWEIILILFSLGFATIIPGLQWSLEDRQVERAMYNEGQLGEDGEGGEVRYFRYLKLNPLPGLSKVKLLLKADTPRLRRPVKVLMRTASIVFNVSMIVQQNVSLLVGSVEFYSGTRTDDLSYSVMRKYIQWAEKMSPLISVHQATCVALAELLGLITMFIWLSYRLVIFLVYRNNGKAKYDAYIAVYDFFDSWNLLADYSALRLLNIAHPALLVRKFQVFMVKPFLGNEDETHRRLRLGYFFFTRLCAVFLGVLAFGVKLAFVSVQVHPDHDTEATFFTQVWRWIVVLTLLVQTLGAIEVEHVMWWRVMLLLMQGGQRRVTLDRVRSVSVYIAQIMFAIQKEFCREGQYLNWWMLMMTFDHVDLQYLLIEEKSERVCSGATAGIVSLESAITYSVGEGTSAIETPRSAIETPRSAIEDGRALEVSQKIHEDIRVAEVVETDEPDGQPG